MIMCFFNDFYDNFPYNSVKTTCKLHVKIFYAPIPEICHEYAQSCCFNWICTYIIQTLQLLQSVLVVQLSFCVKPVQLHRVHSWQMMSTFVKPQGLSKLFMQCNILVHCVYICIFIKFTMFQQFLCYVLSNSEIIYWGFIWTLLHLLFQIILLI
jgi:hypothetical protein